MDFGPRRVRRWILSALPAMSMAQLLGAFALAMAVPLLTLAFVLYQQMVANERQTVRDGLLSNARILSSLVDNEIDTHVAVAGALAASEALRSGDLAMFRREALKALDVIPGAWLSLCDPSGRRVMTTLSDAADPLPPCGRSDIMAKAWATARPQTTDVELGRLSKSLTASIEYPVFAAGAPLYAVVVSLNPDRFHALIRDKFGEAVAVAVLDRQRRFVARVPDFEGRLGTPAAESWRQEIARAPQGVAETVTLENEPSLTAYAPTRDGWTAGISFPLKVIDEPVHAILRKIGLIALALTLAGLLLGFAVGAQISRAMAELVAAAQRLGRGQAVTAKAFPIREASAISTALSATSDELASRDKALRESEAKFRSTFENAAVGVSLLSLDGRWLEINQRLCDILGYTREELRNKRFQDITDPHDIEVDLANAEKLLKGEIASYAMDKRYIRKDGSQVWCGLTAAVQRDETGVPRYFISIVRDISKRKEAEEHQSFLLRELAHRSKNQLAIVQALAWMTERSATSLDAFRKQFTQRLEGLAISTDLLVAQNWIGAPLADLVQGQLQPFASDPSRLICQGPPVFLGAATAQALGLALHELATNCVKYGAWSSPAGGVTVSWRLDRGGEEPERLHLNWLERGGPAVTPPARKGFGHELIQRMVARKLEGTIDMTFAPEGFGWSISLPRSQYAAESPRARA